MRKGLTDQVALEQVFEAACHAGSGGMNTPGSGKAGSERRLRVCEKQKGQCGWNSEGGNGRKWVRESERGETQGGLCYSV